MGEKRLRMLIGRGSDGFVKIIMTGQFSVSDIRDWTKHYPKIEVRGTCRLGRPYCWLVQPKEVKEVSSNHEGVGPLPGIGDPPRNKIDF